MASSPSTSASSTFPSPASTAPPPTSPSRLSAIATGSATNSALALVGRIAELWRYPVKSMVGESLATVEVNAVGIAGDRLFALQSSAAPLGKPLLRAAERTRALQASARLQPSGEVLVNPGDGTPISLTDPALLRTLASPDSPRSAAPTLTLLHRDLPFTDVRPVSLHSLQLLSTLTKELGRPFDGRRLRSNLVLDFLPGVADQDLLGHTLRIGDQAWLQILEAIPRCRIISLAPLTTEADSTLLRHVERLHAGCLGLYARPLTPGPLRVGDPVYLAR